MLRHITPSYAPGLAEVRALGLGDVLVLRQGATARKDWPRYQDAIGQAVTRGAEVLQPDAKEADQ